jgi:Flp pilus assembly protein TadG
MFGILDVGRGIYVYNGVAEAAREIARVTSVQPGSCPAGSSTMPSTCWSPQMQAVVATQKSLVPGLATSDITISCTDLTGAPQDASQCYVGTGGAGQVRFVKVQVNVPFNIVAFNFLPVQPNFTFTAVSHVQMS